MIRRPPRSTLDRSSAASDVYKRQPMMYIESGWPNIVQALDLSDPDHPVQMWHYNKTSGRDESAVPRACCDTVNRGLSYADGKLVFGTLDGYVIALDAITVSYTHLTLPTSDLV